jgi:kynurenine 3-monooxygenase
MRDLVADPAFRLLKSVEQALARRYPQHFVPRYELVSFTSTPYASAKARGAQQRELLDALCAGKTQLDEIDWHYADSWIQQNLTLWV